MTSNNLRGRPRALAALTTLSLGLTALAVAPALASPDTGGSERAGSARSPFLRHAGTAYLQQNLRPGEEGAATSAEIIAFARGGTQLLYTDAFTRRLGFLDTRNHRTPRPAGSMDLPGDPTSVAVVGRHALVAVVTSKDPDGDGPLDEYDAPAGQLLVVDLRDRRVVRTIELAGQPDSVAVSPSGKRAVVVIENERDEDENDGLIPQLPAGLLQVLDLDGGPSAWSLSDVDLTGLAEVAPQDPEPEFVDINERDLAVVTLQENNHVAVVNLRTGRVVRDFSAGTVDLKGIDTTEEAIGPQGAGTISLDGSLDDRRREPDSVQWVDGDTFATANEGDYTDAEGEEGGSRSFTLFNIDGTVEHESGSAFEHEVVRAGHYPESRSENKGSEPEGLEVGRFGGRTYLFVAAERANAVVVYRMAGRRPVFRQLLPTGNGPEGLVFRNGALVVSSEVDGVDEGFAARPFITFFGMERSNRPAYPGLVSIDDAAGRPIPWAAQSGLAGDPWRKNVLWSVSDSVLGQAYIYRIDVRQHPARIVDRVPVGATDVADQTTGDFDLEGIAARRDGGFWLASEGRIDDGSSRPNLLVRADRAGRVLDTVALPGSLTGEATSSGFEGVAVTGTAQRDNEVVYVALQREWGDDAEGFVKIGRYEVASAEWTFASYRLDEVESPAGGWVGLSELTLVPGGHLAVVERDNQLGLEAAVKRVYLIDPASVEFAAHGEELPVLRKRLVRDLLRPLDRASVAVPDKVEGLGLTRDRRAFVVTDNDGVDENYGETVFLRSKPW